MCRVILATRYNAQNPYPFNIVRYNEVRGEVLDLSGLQEYVLALEVELPFTELRPLHHRFTLGDQALPSC